MKIHVGTRDRWIERWKAKRESLLVRIGRGLGNVGPKHWFLQGWNFRIVEMGSKVSRANAEGQTMLADLLHE